MSTDSRIDSDLKALAESTKRGLPSHEETARALARARAQRSGGFIMKTIRNPMWATAIAVAIAAAVLVFPVPYTRTVGFDLGLRSRDGHVANVRLTTRDRAQAERRAALLRKNGTVVTLAPRTERVWGSVYAMAKEKLLQIHVDLDGKTDTEVADDIRNQVSNAGWNASDVQVQRSANGSTVEISADDGSGRQMKVVRVAKGGSEKEMDLEVGAIDDTREPGMTDAQLRDKILQQLKARGLDGDVVVKGNQIEIRARGERTETE
jgi:hypothetical protein